MASLPISFTELLSLPQLDIAPTSIGFNTTTLESDRYICVRETSGEAAAAQVVIIDLHNGNQLTRRTIKADSAIMHWSKNIIALKAQRTLQIFNLDAKEKLKSYAMPEDVVFWKWISERALGLITESSVFHWDILDPSQTAPVKVFDRHSNLKGSQIINYRVNSDEKWMVVVGISSQQGRVVGNMQLYSKDRSISQAIEGHAAAFAEIRLEGATSPTKLFTFSVRTQQGAKLHVVEVDHSAGNPVFQKKAVDVYFPAEAVNDFPVAMQVSQRFSVIYLVTKYGFIHLYDLETGTCIFMNRISSETIFTTTRHDQTSGIICVNRKGQVLSVSVDENQIIPYLLQNPANSQLAINLASRAGLAGADDLYQQQFNQLMSQSNFVEAAKVAANSPRGFLRTPQTIEKFKAVPAPPGQLSVILQYFGMLLDKTTLNRYETIELVKPVLAQNRKHLLEKWLKENKLECTEELGDIVRSHDINMALGIYLRANAPQKVVASFAETGQFDKILPYAQKVGYNPDYTSLLQHIVRINPEKGSEFATQLASHEGGALVDIDRVVDVFLSQSMIQQATAFLLTALEGNRPEHANQQTRLLEMNLLNAPQVAAAILGNNMFSYYDKAKVAQLCENAGLFQQALEHYEDPAAVKRVLCTNAAALSPEFVIQYFGRLSVEDSLDCLREMLRVNIRQNLQVVIQIATKYSDLLGPHRLIELFESFKTFEGLFYYLGTVVNLSEDGDVVFKYVQAATRMGKLSEVERICRDNNFYNPEKVKNFLKEAQLTEQMPLIIVCDRFNFIHDLVLYLYRNQQFKSIEVYVQRVNPARTPAVIGGLLDVDCEESIIKGLLQSVSSAAVPVDELVAEVEKRNRLKMLLPFLESMLNAGNEQPAVYNALAKIYIDSNNNPEKFLKENDKYDSAIVGKYCEKRDPYLAFIAYQKGQNDLELVRITNENSMFKHQARYLVARRDPELWTFVLSPNNIHRRPLVDQVVATAVPESTDPEDISTAVQSFLQNDLPTELIELLEKIILEPSPFSDNNNLQNLIILTAVKADKSRVMDYINRLSNYDGPDIANICIENGLFEEALEVYKKGNSHSEAINVLIEHIVSIDRAYAYADRVDLPEVWSRLGKAQIDGLRITDGIESYIRAEDPSNYGEVIEMSTRAGKFDELIKYLQMCRRTLREPPIDSALALCLARVNKLHELEDFLNAANVASIEDCGDTAYEEGLHQAAKIFYTIISNWAKLATTLVFLEEYQNAVECARKANSTKVWKQVHEACVGKKEFRLSQICGLNLIVHAEELHDVVKQYERNGYFDELISLLENGLGLERAHMGMFTELGIALTKYHPDRVMEHLKLFWSRINIPKMIRACEQAHLWPELIFLYCHYDEWDNAALAMMERAADAWEHQSFKDIIVKVANLEIYYRALNFYLQEQPRLLTDLLSVLAPRIDVARVVRMFENSDNIPLIKPFLLNVQSQNNKVVNNAINDLLIEEEDYKTLRDSVENYDNYDPVELAQRLEQHELVFFRQVAASIYRKHKRWNQSIALSKQDKLFKDAIETAAVSVREEVVDELLRYFVDIGNRECYAAMLYACYDLIPVHTVMEISWRYGLNDYAMPFMINVMREQSMKISTLEKDNEERKAKEASQKKIEDNTPILGNGPLMITAGPGAQPYGNGLAPQPTGFVSF